MVNYICPKCNKDFNKKSHYVEHTENKKKPCDRSDFLVPPNPAKVPPNPAKNYENPSSYPKRCKAQASDLNNQTNLK